MAIPAPEPGLVINYAYLWHHEHQAGHEEGRKDRPSVIVLCVERPDDRTTVVTVLPITHRPPADSTAAMEIPHAIKQHLGLDDERSWVVVSEGNEFVWPGYDLRKRPRSHHYDYGFLPPRFFDLIRRAFVAFHRRGRSRRTPRS
jgi:hypothetical protein